MFSKNMTFSLMRLITILALAFGVPSAMAAEFGVSLDTFGDVSHADGLQLQDAATITVTVKFDRAVVLVAEDILVSAYDKDGAFLALPTIRTINPTTPTQEITIAITRPDGTARLTFRTKNGIASADPFNEDTSVEGNWDIGLLNVATLDGGPEVYMIALVGFPFTTITTATFQVHVLLSEEPKDGFNKDLLEVTNATVSSVVKLASPGSSAMVNGTTVHASWRDDNLHAYLVTLASKPGAKTVVIKVKNFAGMERPTTVDHTYTRPPDSTLTEGRDKLTLKTNWDGQRTVVITVYVPEDTTIPADTDTITTPETQEADAPATVAETEVTTDTDATATEIPDTSVMIPKEGQIYISEIMFAGGGTLPQWIEISNGSRTEQVNLSGWTLTVENATADATVKVRSKVRIPDGTRTDPSGQHDTPSTLLIVAKQGRNNLKGSMAERQVINLDIFRSRPRYVLLSDMAFRITLAPPTRPIVPEWAAARDVVGNLADDGTAAWVLPTNESGPRSSMIRRHASSAPEDGTMIDAWVLASDTGLVEPMHSYYGFPTDIGTPGFRAGGALPVELSHFRPERQKDRGVVVITWSTQSELNNAGFFIKRHRQRDGQFQIINATMIPGAGTTSEKQFYTYTDTTAQANVVYYYQIEDVSLDGNRQTLTRGIRLKGHVSVVGKATVLWGELKVSHE